VLAVRGVGGSLHGGSRTKEGAAYPRVQLNGEVTSRRDYCKGGHRLSTDNKWDADASHLGVEFAVLNRVASRDRTL
jgi:hypothetical protein